MHFHRDIIYDNKKTGNKAKCHGAASQWKSNTAQDCASGACAGAGPEGRAPSHLRLGSSPSLRALTLIPDFPKGRWKREPKRQVVQADRTDTKSTASGWDPVGPERGKPAAGEAEAGVPAASSRRSKQQPALRHLAWNEAGGRGKRSLHCPGLVAGRRLY